MKRSVIFILVCIVMAGCAGSSEPENILRRGVEALHNNDIEGVMKYFDIDEDRLELTKNNIDENNGWLWDKVEIEKSVLRSNYDGEKDAICYVLGNLTLRNGQTVRGEFRLNKKEDGSWKIVGDFEEDPARFEIDITQTADTPKGKHPVLGDVLDAYEKLDVRFMNIEDFKREMKESGDAIIGNEIPLGGKESQGVKISKAVVYSVGPGAGSDLSVLFDLIPEDPNFVQNYPGATKAWGGGYNGVYLYCTFNSDEGVIDQAAIVSHDGKSIRALMRVRHNRIGMWRNLKYISMIDAKSYEILTSKHHRKP